MILSRRKKSIVIIVCIFAILLFSGAIYLAFRTSNDKNISPENSNASENTNNYYSFDVSNMYVDHTKYLAGQREIYLPPEGKTFSQLVDNFDTYVLTLSIQGNVNRQKPTLYLYQSGFIENFWQTELKSKNLFPTSGQEVKLATIDDLINQFSQSEYNIKGSVVWDKDRAYTLDMAVTIAGADNLIIVRKNSSIYSKVISKFPVKVDLCSNNFSSKDQGYRWLVQNYLATGKVNSIIGYVKDGYTLKLYTEGKMFPNSFAEPWGNAIYDRLIAEKAFVVDLAPSTSVYSPDEPSAVGKDVETFSYVLSEMRKRVGANDIIPVWGFPSRKYVNADCNGDGAITEGDYTTCGEWPAVKLLSEYGAVKRFGSGDMWGKEFTNSSFFKYGTTTDYIPSNPPLTPAELVSKGYLTGDPNNLSSLQINKNKNYVMYYLGDYDLAIAAYIGYPTTARSKSTTAPAVPVAWSYSPTIREELPSVFSYIIKSTDKYDYFVMPDSGKGYANPEYFSDNFISTWVTESTNANRVLGYQSGWYLAGTSTKIASSGTGRNAEIGAKLRDMYKVITPQGVYYPSDSTGGGVFEGTLPVVPMVDIFANGAMSTDAAAAKLKGYLDEESIFLVTRNIWGNPATQAEITQKVKQLGGNIDVLDPITFFQLYKFQHGQMPTLRTTLIEHNIPSSMVAGQQYSISMKYRNDGWETWKGVFQTGVNSCDGQSTANSGCYRFAWIMQSGKITPVGPASTNPSGTYSRVTLPTDVKPGEMTTVSFTITAPSQSGDYTFQMDIVKEAYSFGETVGNVPWQKSIKVVGSSTVPVTTVPVTTMPVTTVPVTTVPVTTVPVTTVPVTTVPVTTVPVTTVPVTTVPITIEGGYSICDYNRDKKVNLTDYYYFVQDYRTYHTSGTFYSRSDFNSDYKVNMSDYYFFVGYYKANQ